MSGIVPDSLRPTPLDSITDINSPAINVRPYEFVLLVSQGRIENHSWVPKSGKNPDIDPATVPEDVWGNGGLYTGFPTGAAETFQAVSDSASDTGTLTILYLASYTSEDYQTATVTLNGLTPVNFSVSGIRVHSAFYSDGTATGFNIGTIMVRHAVTTSNVFVNLVPGTNQSYSTGYTVPYNTTSYLYDFFSSIEGGTATAAVEGALWVRQFGLGPRLRRTFVAEQGMEFSLNLYGALVFPALTDIIVRITRASANNTITTAGYNLLNIKNT